jgi:hypothetical protein
VAVFLFLQRAFSATLYVKSGQLCHLKLGGNLTSAIAVKSFILLFLIEKA